MKSLERRVLAVLPLWCAVCALLAGLVLLVGATWQQNRVFDAGLQHRHQELATILRWRDGQAVWPQGRDGLVAEERVAIQTSEGRVHTLGGPGPDPVVAGWSRSEGWRWWTAPASLRPTGPAWRGQGPVTVQMAVGRPIGALSEVLDQQALLVAGLAFLAGFLSLLVSRPLARHLLRPVSELSHEIQNAPVGAAGLPVRQRPVDLQPIAAAVDGLLLRVHDGLERERRSAAHLAHELRTPLAGLRAVLELALHRERDAASYRASLAEAAVIRDQAEAVAERLLQLTRLELGEGIGQSAVVDLADAAWAVAAELGLEPGILDCEPAALIGDPVLVNQLVAILAGNLRDHGAAGGRHLTTRSQDGWAVVETRNRCDLAAADLPRLGELGWRGDPGRGGGHAGLGLALARRIIALHGGRFIAELSDGDLVVRAAMPAAAGPQS